MGDRSTTPEDDESKGPGFIKIRGFGPLVDPAITQKELDFVSQHMNKPGSVVWFTANRALFIVLSEEQYENLQQNCFQGELSIGYIPKKRTDAKDPEEI